MALILPRCVEWYQFLLRKVQTKDSPQNQGKVKPRQITPWIRRVNAHSTRFGSSWRSQWCFLLLSLGHCVPIRCNSALILSSLVRYLVLQSLQVIASLSLKPQNRFQHVQACPLSVSMGWTREWFFLYHGPPLHTSTVHTVAFCGSFSLPIRIALES